MAERIVVNAGPLIALARAEVLHVVAHLPLEFVCPEEVAAELDAGIQAGYPVARPAWLRTLALSAPLNPVALSTVDSGEAAVIQLALEQGIPRVCMDDLKGRRVAQAAGLSVIGSLGLLVRAKRAGILPALRPVVEKAMREGVWYDAKLVARVLQGVGE